MTIGLTPSLESDPKQSFADLARLAAELCWTSHAAVCLSQADPTSAFAWYSRETSGPPLADVVWPRFFTGEDLREVPDLLKDPQFAHSPLVVVIGARFYAAAALRRAQGAVLGWLCVLDAEPRPDGLTVDQQTYLASLARQAVTILELGQAVQRYRTQETLSDRSSMLSQIAETLRVPVETFANVDAREDPNIDLLAEYVELLGAFRHVSDRQARRRCLSYVKAAATRSSDEA